jgi:hypothetical protein
MENNITSRELSDSPRIKTCGDIRPVRVPATKIVVLITAEVNPAKGVAFTMRL